MIDGFAGVGIGANDAEFSGVGAVGIVVERVELSGERVVGEFGSYEIAGGDEGS